jgi:hypothetical protein
LHLRSGCWLLGHYNILISKGLGNKSWILTCNSSESWLDRTFRRWQNRLPNRRRTTTWTYNNTTHQHVFSTHPPTHRLLSQHRFSTRYLQGLSQPNVTVAVGTALPHPHGTVTVSVFTHARPAHLGRAIVVIGSAGG